MKKPIALVAIVLCFGLKSEAADIDRSLMSDAYWEIWNDDVKAQIDEDVQAIKSMNKVRKLNDISQKMKSMEKANPETFRNDPEYQKLSQQFETQSRIVREDKVAVDRMNALGGETGTNLRKRYDR